MTKQEIVTAVTSLHLPEGSYIVYGSGPLAAAGIRQAGDVDMLVTGKLLQEFRAGGWKEIIKAPDDKPLTYGLFEAHDNWDFSPYAPTLEQLLMSATYIDGVPFASLLEVRKWKAASGGPKHEADVRLIDDYLAGRR